MSNKLITASAARKKKCGEIAKDLVINKAEYTLLECNRILNSKRDERKSMIDEFNIKMSVTLFGLRESVKYSDFDYNTRREFVLFFCFFIFIIPIKYFKSYICLSIKFLPSLGGRLLYFFVITFN